MTSYPDDYEPPMEYVDGFSAVMFATPPYALGMYDLDGSAEDREHFVDYLRGVCDGIEAAFTTGIDRLELAQDIAEILGWQLPETRDTLAAHNADR
jgi:hypothetical protein